MLLRLGNAIVEESKPELPGLVHLSNSLRMRHDPTDIFLELVHSRYPGFQTLVVHRWMELPFNGSTGFTGGIGTGYRGLLDHRERMSSCSPS